MASRCALSIFPDGPITDTGTGNHMTRYGLNRMIASTRDSLGIQLEEERTGNLWEARKSSIHTTTMVMTGHCLASCGRSIFTDGSITDTGIGNHMMRHGVNRTIASTRDCLGTQLEE